jgi:GTP-binding protein
MFFTILFPDNLHPSHLLSIYSVGIHQRPGDLAVNVCKTKQLTNMRSATKGITTGITAPIEMSMDACVEYLASDEILEVTPSKFRMAKNPDMLGKKKKK